MKIKLGSFLLNAPTLGSFSFKASLAFGCFGISKMEGLRTGFILGTFGVDFLFLGGFRRRVSDGLAFSE